MTATVTGPIMMVTAKDGTYPEMMLLQIRYSGTTRHIVLYVAGHMWWITAAVAANTKNAKHMSRSSSRTTRNAFLHIMIANRRWSGAG